MNKIEIIDGCFLKTINSKKLIIGNINKTTLILSQEYLSLKDVNTICDIIKDTNKSIKKVKIVA